MKKYLVAESIVKPDKIDLSQLDAKYRKATMNMVLSSIACENVLQSIPDVARNEISVIFATHFGEVEASLDFLFTYRQTQVSSPILFQNSLHNSSLGFSSLTLNLTGPGLTISADKDTESSAQLTALSLLNWTPYVLVCFIDYIPDKLIANYLRNHPYLEKFINQAHAYLYSRNRIGAN